ncbi:MAG: PH domain-containing protein [Balneolaceae bacterium]
MSEFRRQHPVAAITRAVDLIRDNFITILILMVVGAGGSEGVAFIWWFTGLLFFLLTAGVADWWRFQYWADKEKLNIRQGVLVRKNLTLTRERIQVIDVTSGVVQRLFGLVSVEVQTAGSGSREAYLSAVTTEEAERLTALLRNGYRQLADEGTEAAVSPESRYPLPVRELLIAASTSGSFGIALSIIATLFSQVEPLLTETEIHEWFAAELPETDTLFFVSLIAVFVLFAWLLSFLGVLLSYGNFCLELRDDEMVITRGLLEKKRITVPFNRIQAVRVVEGVMRQPFGFANISVESAGFGDQKGSGSVVIHPLIRRSRVSSFLREVLPEYDGEPRTSKPPLRSLTRYMIRSTAVLAIAVGALWLLAGTGDWIWVLLLPGLAWGWLRHRDAEAGADERRLLLCGRVLARTTAIVLKNRVQDVTVSTSLIQRYRNLMNLEVRVASGEQGRGFLVREMEPERARELLGWMAIDNPFLQTEKEGT